MGWNETYTWTSIEHIKREFISFLINEIHAIWKINGIILWNRVILTWKVRSNLAFSWAYNYNYCSKKCLITTACTWLIKNHTLGASYNAHMYRKHNIYVADNSYIHILIHTMTTHVCTAASRLADKQTDIHEWKCLWYSSTSLVDINTDMNSRIVLLLATWTWMNMKASLYIMYSQIVRDSHL